MGRPLVRRCGCASRSCSRFRSLSHTLTHPPSIKHTHTLSLTFPLSCADAAEPHARVVLAAPPLRRRPRILHRCESMYTILTYVDVNLSFLTYTHTFLAYIECLHYMF